MHRGVVHFLIVCLLVLTSGCVTTGYRDAVARFALSTVAVSEALSSQMSAADVQARQQAVFEGYGGFEDLSTMASPKAAALAARGRMTDEQRRTRKKALVLLGAYGALLQKLSVAETPGDAAAAAKTLGSAADDLITAVVTSEAVGGESPFAGLGDPLAALSSAALKAALEAAIRNALDEAIAGGTEAIAALAPALERDVAALHADRRAWLGERRNVLNTALKHTVEAAKTDPAALLQVIELTERVVAADDALRLWSAVRPEAAPRALLVAHGKLKVYAEGGHKEEALVDAATAVYALGNATYQLVDALRLTDPAAVAGETE